MPIRLVITAVTALLREILNKEKITARTVVTSATATAASLITNPEVTTIIVDAAAKFL